MLNRLFKELGFRTRPPCCEEVINLIMKTEEFFPTSKIYISKKMKINIVLFDHNSASDQLKPLPECITEGVREGFNISETAKN